MQERIPNERQQAVIDELDGNIILYASAGTGKTFTVAKRAASIIASGRAKADEILCLTFTIKAAQEMKEDILNYTGEDGKDVDVCTIHSFSYSVLKEEYILSLGRQAYPTVCDEVETAALLRRILTELGEENGIDKTDFRILMPEYEKNLPNVPSLLKHEREKRGIYSNLPVMDYQLVFNALVEEKSDKLRSALMYYDRQKGKRSHDSAYFELLKTHCGAFMAEYDRRLKESNRLDYDDLICMTRRLFQKEDIRSKYRARYKYLFIDEMQDTSELEYDLIRQLFHGNHVMLCGDIFQTIYEWRGSCPERNLKDFAENFAAQQFMFSENYRSTRLLTRASFAYLKKTFPELIGTCCPDTIEVCSSEDGEEISVASVRDNADYILNYLEKNSCDPERTCILARNNASILRLHDRMERICRQRGLDFRFFSNERDIQPLKHEAVRVVLSFYRLLLNPYDVQSLDRICENRSGDITAEELTQVRSAGVLGLCSADFLKNETYETGDCLTELLKAKETGSIVIYDTETTGLDTDGDELIQISAIRLSKDGGIADTLDLMVLPQVPISRGAQATHHQTIEDIRAAGAVSQREAIERFDAFAKDCVLVGHNNLGFDAPLIKSLHRRCGAEMPRIRAEYDTLLLSRELLPKLSDHKLDTVCRRFGIVNTDAHNALGDITATGRLLWALLEKHLIPNTEKRREFIAGHAPKYRKLFDFLSLLRTEYLDKNLLAEMTEQIIKKSRLADDGSREALRSFMTRLTAEGEKDARQVMAELISGSLLTGSRMEEQIRNSGRIPILTVHQSKGCEFDTVFLTDMDEKSFSSAEQELPEEEKRVFYVAITRAKRKLVIVCGNKATRLLNNIPPQYIEYV